MKNPRVRFTVRRLMVAVAVVALLVTSSLRVDTLIRRSGRYRQEAARQEFIRQIRLSQRRNDEAMGRADEASLKAARLLYPPDSPIVRMARGRLDRHRLDAGRYRKQAEHRASLRDKYARAAARPWLAIDPDPPEPE